MKKKIAILTDSTALSYAGELDLENVFIVPAIVIINDKSYREFEEISQSEIFRIIKEGKSDLKTSQPVLGDLINLYNKLSEEYESVLTLLMSSQVSGAFQTAKTASKMTEANAYFIDTKTIAKPLKDIVRYAAKRVSEDVQLNDLIAEIEDLVDRTRVFATPADLEQLKRSGRISGVASFVSNLIGLKLIVSFVDGKPTLVDKVRTDKKTRKNIEEKFHQDYIEGCRDLSVIHIDSLEEAEKWKASLQSVYPDLNITTDLVTSALGVHLGVGTIGLSWIKPAK